ncbi:MAG: hypothetical protein CM15mV57_250 [uncultured marine virus]|nr:MAG: hypothetical protein CM15mV57_250 [uncultured marine virus]
MADKVKQGVTLLGLGGLAIYALTISDSGEYKVGPYGRRTMLTPMIQDWTRDSDGGPPRPRASDYILLPRISTKEAKEVYFTPNTGTDALGLPMDLPETKFRYARLPIVNPQYYPEGYKDLEWGIEYNPRERPEELLFFKKALLNYEYGYTFRNEMEFWNAMINAIVLKVYDCKYPLFTIKDFWPTNPYGRLENSGRYTTWGVNVNREIDERRYTTVPEYWLEDDIKKAIKDGEVTARDLNNLGLFEVGEPRAWWKGFYQLTWPLPQR